MKTVIEIASCLILSTWVFAQAPELNAIDPCTLLTPDEVQTLIGGSVGAGEENNQVMFRQCDWTGLQASGAYTGVLQLRVEHNPLYTTPEDLVEFITYEGMTVGFPLENLEYTAAYATEVRETGTGPIILFALYAGDLILWGEAYPPEAMTPESQGFEQLKRLMSIAAGRLSE